MAPHRVAVRLKSVVRVCVRVPNAATGLRVPQDSVVRAPWPPLLNGPMLRIGYDSGGTGERRGTGAAPLRDVPRPDARRSNGARGRARHVAECRREA